MADAPQTPPAQNPDPISGQGTNLQQIIDYWMGQGDPNGKLAPQINNLRQGVFNNWSPNGQQYNTGDSLSSNYPWMPSMSSAASALAPMMNGQAMQTPVGQLMQQSGSNSGANLRQQMFLANQMLADQKKAATPAVDQTVRTYSPPNGDELNKLAQQYYDARWAPVSWANNIGPKPDLTSQLAMYGNDPSKLATSIMGDLSGTQSALSAGQYGPTVGAYAQTYASLLPQFQSALTKYQNTPVQK